jgi:hypothetical protein
MPQIYPGSAYARNREGFGKQPDHLRICLQPCMTVELRAKLQRLPGGSE